MAIFKPTSWGIVKALRDLTNYADFRRIIKKERQNPDSKFNKWNLNHNYFYTIYFTMDIKDEEAQLPEEIKRMRLIESLGNLHRYLDEELGFAECLAPEFNQFIDEKGNATLTYLIAYRFTFNKLSMWWIIKWLAIFGAAIVGFNYITDLSFVSNVLNTFGSWLQSLTLTT